MSLYQCKCIGKGYSRIHFIPFFVFWIILDLIVIMRQTLKLAGWVWKILEKSFPGEFEIVKTVNELQIGAWGSRKTLNFVSNCWNLFLWKYIININTHSAFEVIDK